MFEDLFSRQGLSFDRLRSFLAVADAGGIARAAPGKPTRQSQLSRQIGELEAFLGCALTERRGRALLLTVAGEQLAQVTREAFQGLANVASGGRAERTRLDLGAGDSWLHWWIVPRVGAVLARHPDVHLAVRSVAAEDAVAQLLDARLDLAVFRDDAVIKPLTARPLGRLGFALFVPKGMPRDERGDLSRALARVPLALASAEPGFLSRLRALLGRDPKQALTCETFPQACRAVSSGHFASILPLAARCDLPSDGFVALRPDGIDSLAVSLVLACHPRLLRQRRSVEGLLGALERKLMVRKE